MSFRLAYSFTVDAGEPVTVNGAIRLEVPLSESALKDAFTHAVHESFPRIGEALGARAKAKQDATEKEDAA